MIGKKIKERREELGLSQEQLANMLGIGKSAVSNYETNVSSPKEKILLKLFNVLKCDANYFYEDYLNDNIEFNISSSEKRYILKYRNLDAHGRKMVDFTLNEEYDRCISVTTMDGEASEIEIKHSYYKVSAGTGFGLGNDDEWETISIPDSSEARKADFALTIQGNSMEPVYFDGDIVLVKEQPAIDIGQIGIFTIEGEGYIKKYGGDRLISLNAEYDDIIFAEHDEDRIRCVGRVIGRI